MRWLVVLMGSIMTLSGCTYAAMQKLSLDEQAELHIYQKVMTPSQERAHLAKATAAERTAYRSEIGLAQRFQALDPLDREAVRNGGPRVGMRADALTVPLGEPYSTAGDASRYAHWYSWARPSALLTTATKTTILAIARTSLSWLGRFGMGRFYS